MAISAALDMPGAALEPVEVVADGHGQRQKSFERLLGLLKLYRDAAGFDVDAGWKIFELVVYDRDRGFDE